MKKNTEEEFIKIQDLWKMSISKWHWFVISIIVCLSIASVYIAVSPPIYTRSASVLIKEDSKGGMSSENITAFADMGLFKSNTNINNEILTFKSPLLMKEVVLRLKLDENYTVKGLFREKVLYKTTPVVVDLDSLKTEHTFSFYIKLLPNNKVKLYDFAIDSEHLGSSADRNGDLLTSINTVVGNITISPTELFEKGYHDEEIRFLKYSLKGVVNYYTEALKAVLGDENATIINLTIDDESTQRAEDILNMLITIYNENWVKDKNQIAVTTSLFIEDRLNVIESELGYVDDNISKFKSQNLMPDVHVASNLYMAQSTENKAKMLMLNTQYSIAEYILIHLKDSTSKNQLIPANLGIESGNVEGQISEYNKMLLRRNSLQSNSSDTNPLVLDLNQSLISMRKAVIHSINNLLVNLNTQVKDIQRSEKQTNERIASTPEQAKHLLSIERQQKVKEALYLFLLQKREESQLSQTFSAYNTKIVTPPSGVDSPSFPKKMSILLVGLLIGLLLPVVILFILENINTTIRGRKDLSSLSLPFVGEIPQIQKVKGSMFKSKDIKDRGDIIVSEGNTDYMNEAFRVVRTNLDFIINTNEFGSQKVIMFTSFNIGSGKTFTTANLAMSMAIKGKKVVVVDLDMRKASLSTYVNSPSKGVSNYLGKMIDDLDEIIQKAIVHTNLDIIPVGTIPPNPAELLLDSKLVELLHELRNRYDYVFLDCTPVEMVTDAAIVGKVTDITVFVVRAGLLDRRLLPDLEEMYRKGKYNNMSLLLNGAHYIEGHYGYTRYGYNYGYGGNYSSNKK